MEAAAVVIGFPGGGLFGPLPETFPYGSGRASCARIPALVNAQWTRFAA